MSNSRLSRRRKAGNIAVCTYIRIRRLNDAHSGDFKESFGARPMSEFDYNATAELYSTRKRMVRRQPLGYKRFAQAAQAIRFAIEDLPAELLIGAFLEVGEERYDGDKIRRLYESAHYPLARRAA
jgi:hypothetical protein